LRVHRGSDVGSDHFLALAKLRFPPKPLRLPKKTTGKENIKLVTQWRKYRMAMQTKNSIETARNYRKQQHCFGVEKHQNHNVTGSRRNFWENAKPLHKRKN
jgi:hypothetical protein